MVNPFTSVIDQMHAAGITGLQDTDLIVDGVLHRFRPDDSSSKTGWYVLHEFITRDSKTLLFGAFGDWREGVPHKIEPPEAFRLSDEERDAYKKERDKQQRAQAKKKNDRQRAAALRAQKWWDKLSDAPLNEGEDNYLVRKQVQPYGVKYSPKGAVVVPLTDMGGAIHGLQFIHKEPRIKDGDEIGKDFAPWGMNPKGHFHLIGVIPEPAASRRVKLGICEGYATGASLHEATGIPIFVAFNAGNLMPVAKVVREAYPDAEIYIFADDDYLTKKPVDNPGVTEGRKVAKAVKGRVVVPLFSTRNGEKWTDYNDLHVQESIDVVHDQIMQSLHGQPEQKQTKQMPVIEIAPGQEWQWQFSRTQSGTPRADVNNARLVLANDDEWQGVMAYCDFNCAVMKLKPPPFEDNAETGEWSDADTARLRCWLAGRYDFSPKTNDVDDAVLVAAQAKRYHPVREYLEGLKWNETSRLDDWLTDFMGVEKTPYNMAVGKKWLIGAVARIYEPGCKMDNVLIFEGSQGKGKSTALRILGGDWFSDTHFDLGTKDAYQQMRGVWIYEMAEMDAFNKAESTRAKAFFTAQEDNYRPSYGRRNVRVPRQCVIAGSTNNDHYLKDVTGNRRYWPVRCTEIDLDLLREARDQLWAEAVVLYKKKEPWRVLPGELEHFEEAQEERYQEDPWESDIRHWLNAPEQRGTNQFLTSSIMKGGLVMVAKDITPPNTMRVGFIMKRIGWSKARRRDENSQLQYYYIRPEKEVVKQTESEGWGDDLPC